MKNISVIIVAVLALLGVAAGGYWLGTRSAAPSSEAVAAKAERKLLYYRNPMGLPDTSPVPKKDAMGMDYVPVYEGDAEQGGAIAIGIDKVQKLGVKSEAAALRVLDRTLRVVGRIEIDERRTFVVAPKFEGWVERLHVNTTGQSVAKGQPLFEVYSPDLLSARRERELAAQGIDALKDADDEAKDGMRRLAESSAARLKNWEPGKKYVLILDIVPQRKLSAGFLDFDREKIVDTIAHGAACAHAFFNGFADKHATSFREFLQNYHPPEFRFLRYRYGPWREKLLKLIAGC